LEIGNIDLYKDDPSSPTSLIGHYPLILYSKKTHIIPEAANKGILPPLVLTKDNDPDNATYLMGSNLNVDTMHQHFVLDSTEVLLDVPEMVYSFHLYFDMITRNTDFFNYNGYQFKIMDFFLFSKNELDEETELMKVGVFVKVDDLDQITKDGHKIHSGMIYIGLKSSFSGTVSPTQWSDAIPLVTENNNNPGEIFNEAGEIYSSPEINAMGYFRLLSPQPFLFTV
jgi:hypothetical protein